MNHYQHVYVFRQFSGVFGTHSSLWIDSATPDDDLRSIWKCWRGQSLEGSWHPAIRLQHRDPHVWVGIDIILWKFYKMLVQKLSYSYWILISKYQDFVGVPGRVCRARVFVCIERIIDNLSSVSSDLSFTITCNGLWHCAESMNYKHSKNAIS